LSSRTEKGAKPVATDKTVPSEADVLASAVSNDATESSTVADDEYEDNFFYNYYTYSGSQSEWTKSFRSFDEVESSKVPPHSQSVSPAKQRRGRFLVWPASR
jgi:hypothetical protein